MLSKCDNENKMVPYEHDNDNDFVETKGSAWVQLYRSNPKAYLAMSRDNKGNPMSLAQVHATKRHQAKAGQSWKGPEHCTYDHTLWCIIGQTEDGKLLRKYCHESNAIFLHTLFETDGSVYYSTVPFVDLSCFDFHNKFVKEQYKNKPDEAFTAFVTFQLSSQFHVNVPKALAMGTWVMQQNCNRFVRAMTDTTRTLLGAPDLLLDHQYFFGVPCEPGYAPSLRKSYAVVVVVFHSGASIVVADRNKHQKKLKVESEHTRFKMTPNHPCVVPVNIRSSISFENNNESTGLVLGMLLGLKNQGTDNQLVPHESPVIDTDTQVVTQSLPHNEDTDDEANVPTQLETQIDSATQQSQNLLVTRSEQKRKRDSS